MYTVQIGCHTGDDPFIDFFDEKKEDISKCLMIEALSSSLKLCEERYAKRFAPEHLDKISFINKAIVDNADINSIDFFFPEGEHEKDGEISYTAFSSTDKNHLLSHGIKNINKRSVEAVTLHQLFKDFSLDVVDRLYLDAEGLDAKILLSLDLSSVDIPFICFEATHTDGSFTRGDNCQQVYKHLKENGYKIFTFLHKGGQEGYDTDQLDWNWWALKDGDEYLQQEVVEFAGHKSKYDKGNSLWVELNSQ